MFGCRPARKLGPMATPRFVPPVTDLRPPRRMDFGGIPPARRLPLRPGAGRRPPLAPGFGSPCPDGGYALLLAHLADDDVMLEPGEEREDANWAIATVAMRRAGVLGRAPFAEDVKIARTLLAYDGSEDGDFSGWRVRRLTGVADDADLRQRLADVAIVAAEMHHPVDVDAARRWRAALRQHV